MALATVPLVANYASVSKGGLKNVDINEYEYDKNEMAAGCASGSPIGTWDLAFVSEMGMLKMCKTLPNMPKGCKLLSETYQPAPYIFS